MLHAYTAVVTPLCQNARVLFDDETNEAAIIDPGGDAELIETLLRKINAICRQTWLTHSHIDHCGSVRFFLSKTPAKLYAHKADEKLRSMIEQTANELGLSVSDYKNCPEPETYLQDGDILHVGKHSFSVLHTPGHSPGHVAFYNPESQYVISGDSIFRECIGRTSLPGGNATSLLQSIREKILSLPPQTRILCGHGQDTTVEHELRYNFYIR